MPQVIETKCTACFLCKTAYTVGMQGKVSERENKFKIFLDYPSQEDDMRHEFGESRTSRFLVWMMRRNSIDDRDYDVFYTVKCALPKKNSLPNNERKWEVIDACSPLRLANLQNPPYTIVTMGDISCLAFLRESMPKKIHCDWKSPEKLGRVFVAYSPGYGLKKPAESVAMSRQLWFAAEHAGLKPKLNRSIKMFDYEVI